MAETMTLRHHAKAVEKWLRGQGSSVEWDKVLVGDVDTARDLSDILVDKLHTVDEMEDVFSIYLANGYSWINILALGVRDKALVLLIELPREAAGCPPERVSINYSGSATPV